MTKVARPNRFSNFTQLPQAATCVSLPLLAAAFALVACKSRDFNAATNSKKNPNIGGFYKGPPGALSETANKEMWNAFCVESKNDDGESVPKPKYTHIGVVIAAKKLAQVAPKSFSMYSDIMYHYKSKAPEGVTQDAHNFLAYLCGEFRDRAQMIAAKLRWVSTLTLLPTQDNWKFDPDVNPWQQLTTNGYLRFINISNQIYSARENALTVKAKIGSIEDIDHPVQPYNHCEIKYIFKNYVFKKEIKTEEVFPGLEAYETGLATFSKTCSQDEKDTYYTFRGDSNFKPNSPESNGMIYFSRSVAARCETREKAKNFNALMATAKRRYKRALETAPWDHPKPPTVGNIGRTLSDSDCKAYFDEPFKTRWNASRAGLATWMIHDQASDNSFQDAGLNVTVYPHTETALRPLDYTFLGPHSWESNSSTPPKGTKGGLLPGWQAEWLSPDFGISKLSGQADTGAQKAFVYGRIRDAVNRHTNWYSSAFNDGGTMNRDQAYSPFVASSYEMSKSNDFAQPGATVKTEGDGKKHWMFVFKVKKSNWYTSLDAQAGKRPDFEQMWFDERSMGTEYLAKSERAWDRLGTALEDELDSVLYLHNIDAHASSSEAFITEAQKKKKLKKSQLDAEDNDWKHGDWKGGTENWKNENEKSAGDHETFKNGTVEPQG